MLHKTAKQMDMEVNFWEQQSGNRHNMWLAFVCAISYYLKNIFIFFHILQYLKCRLSLCYGTTLTEVLIVLKEFAKVTLQGQDSSNSRSDTFKKIRCFKLWFLDGVALTLGREKGDFYNMNMNCIHCRGEQLVFPSLVATHVQSSIVACCYIPGE